MGKNLSRVMESVKFPSVVRGRFLESTMNFFRFFLLITILSTFTTRIATARAVQLFSMEEMTQKADVIAVIEPLENKLTNTKGDFGVNWAWDPARFQGIATLFKVHSCFKGALPDKFTLIHFVYRPEVSIIDGAEFIQFLIGPLRYQKNVLVNDKPSSGGPIYFQLKPLWLAFLKRMPDGNFEPITGQYDAALSFKEIHEASFYMGQ